MNKNSNQVGFLLLIAVVMGAVLAAFMFFGTKMEQTNMSASFGHLSKKSSANLLSNNKEATGVDFQAKEIRSDLSGVALPSHKMKSTSSADYAQYSSPDFNTTGVMQVDVQNMNNSSSVVKTNTNVHYASNYSQSLVIGNSNADYISNSQNPTKADISGLLLLDTRAAEAAMTTQQGSKRATPALASKTASVSASLAGKGPQKLDGAGGAGDPGFTGSLPVGDGVWILLALLSLYSLGRTKAYNRFFTV
ncbi:MAG: hypothetical protein WCJ61_13495 [Paludibacter sp.]